MGLIPEQYFLVRRAAWWGGETMEVAPDRDEAMRRAGHDWNIELRSVAASAGEAGSCHWEAQNEYRAHRRSDTGELLAILPHTFEPIPNEVAYDLAELLREDPEFRMQYETGGSMDNGRQNFLTLVLDKPFTITRDDSVTLPYVAMSWAHDGSGALKARTTSVRQVCQNTVSMSEAEGAKLGTQFTFSLRHTKNVGDRITEVKKTLKGMGEEFSRYRKAMEDLASLEVTPRHRDLFVSTIIGDRVQDDQGNWVTLSTVGLLLSSLARG